MSNKTNSGRIHCTLVLAVAVPLLATSASVPAAPMPVYGGPTYDSSTSTGYVAQFIASLNDALAVNDAGTAVGYAVKYDAGSNKGPHGVRWDSSGATVLSNLGSAAFPSVTTYARDINSAGMAVGIASKNETSYRGDRAVRWSPGGTAATELDHLGTLGNVTTSCAYAINDAGTAAGYAYTFDAGFSKGTRAVRWASGGTAATELGNLGTDATGYEPGYTESKAYDINSSGAVAGFAGKYDGTGVYFGVRAVRWDAGGTAATELGHIGVDGSGVTSAMARVINDAGTAVGYAQKYDAGSSKGTRAVRWDSGGTAATELGDLGTSGGHANGNAYAINASGTTVGYATKYTAGVLQGTRAVRWDAGGSAATELGGLGATAAGFAEGQAFDINTDGTTVGWVKKYDGAGNDLGPRAVYWKADGVAVDLNTWIDPAGGWVLAEACAISDTDWIAGMGQYDPDGAGGVAAYDRLFLIQVPEPATLGLLVMGGLALLRRRG